jgi:hypothetical protein
MLETTIIQERKNHNLVARGELGQRNAGPYEIEVTKSVRRIRRAATESECPSSGLIDAAVENGFTRLQMAAKDGDLARVKHLVEKCCARVDALSDIGSNALHESAYWGRVDVSSYLIDKGLDPNKRKPDGFGPVHLAILSTNPYPILKLLKARSTDICQSIFR